MNKPKRSRKISTSNSSNLVEINKNDKPTKEPTKSASKIVIDKEKAKLYTDAMIDGLNLLELDDTGEMNVKQLNEIYLGYLSGIDYKKYADPNISHQLMGVIRKSLENNIDVEVIIKPNRVIVKAVQ